MAGRISGSPPEIHSHFVLSFPIPLLQYESYFVSRIRFFSCYGGSVVCSQLVGICVTTLDYTTVPIKKPYIIVCISTTNPLGTRVLESFYINSPDILVCLFLSTCLTSSLLSFVYCIVLSLHIKSDLTELGSFCFIVLYAKLLL